MHSILCGLIVGLFCVLHGVGAAELPALKVSGDGRFLTRADGSPFFYLGDTAWELFHRLNREEADLYLRNRAAKGFTVIEACALAEHDLSTTNAYGELALRDFDPHRPNEVYFQHVDWIVRRAAELGLYVGLLPTWGDKVSKKWGKGPEIFDEASAADYGEWIGKRYAQQPVIWIIGGDRNPDTKQQLAIWRSMARAIKRVTGGRQLMTFHPQGGANSAKWFHADEWLDFNQVQSGHALKDIPNYEFNLANRALKPAKPTFDGEPRYEDHPVRKSTTGEWFDAFDVRQAAYWSMLSGAFGHTYGDHPIWQFLSDARPAITQARTPWTTALDHPGAFQMGHLRRVFETHAWQKLVPDQTLLASDAGSAGDHIRAARAGDNSFAFVYTPTGKSFQIHVDKLPSNPLKASWHDPRNGELKLVGPIARRAATVFTPPSSGRGNDWMLVIDGAAPKPAVK